MADVESGTKDHSNTKFFDYVAPKQNNVKPPAKYKLWLLVFTTVYFAEWFGSEAHYLGWLRETFGLPLNGALIIFLGSIVGTLLFGTIELLIKTFTFKIGDKVYGIGPWLKAPRIKFVHEYNNFFIVLLRTIVKILEDGFDLFALPPPPKPPVKQFEHEGDHDTEVVMRVENNIQPERVQEFFHWREKFLKAGCLSRPGINNVEFEKLAVEGETYVTYITFDNVDHLNEYMMSPIRARMVKNLQKLLVTPTSYQQEQERELPDAFTDLAHGQGKPVPKLLPKKWKVFTITTMGLWLAILVTKSVMPYYHRQWGVSDSHLRAQAVVRVGLNTFLNTFVATPFLMMIFGNWVKRKEGENDQDEPWRTLNDGFKTTYGKFGVFLAYYGTMCLFWTINDLTQDDPQPGVIP